MEEVQPLPQAIKTTNNVVSEKYVRPKWDDYFLNLLDVANLTTMLVMKLLGVFCLWYYWKRKEQRQLLSATQ